MPYTMTDWQDRPEFGGPIFRATLGDDFYKVSGINYSYPAHDGDHHFHEVIVWRNDDEVCVVPNTHNVVRVFHEYLNGEGINV